MNSFTSTVFKKSTVLTKLGTNYQSWTVTDSNNLDIVSNE